MPDERTDAMWRRYSRGASMREIASEFGVTEARVGQILRRSGYPLERGGPQVLARRRARHMHALYESGLSLADVGARFGISGVSVGDVFQRFGLPARPKGSRPTRAADKVLAMHAAYSAGGSLEAVARAFGLSHNRLSELFSEAGLPTRANPDRRTPR